MTPENAFERLAHGDSSDRTFETAIPEVYRQVSKYLVLFGVRGEKLESLAQTAVCRVYMRRERFCGLGLGRLKAALRTTCWRVFLDDGQQRMRPIGDVPAPRPPAGLRDALDQCIDRLPSRDRVLFELRFRLDTPPQEIAELTGNSVRWVQARLTQIRRMLSECLKRSGYDASADK